MNSTWRQTLRRKTRQPEFLWRVVVGIAVAAIALGWAADTWRRRGANHGGEPNEGVEQAAVSDSAWAQIQQWAEQGAWWKVWWAIPASQTWRFQSPGTVVLAALAGAAWFIFLVHAMKTESLLSARFALAVAGVGLGIFSIWLNSIFLLWQEYRWGLQESSDLVGGIKYFVAGVGLREEAAKLLCFLPLLPFLLRMQDRLTVLCTAGCVGIGFALFENTGYYAASGGIGTLGRFLTANPAHLVMTALIGIMVYRAVRAPRDWTSHAVVTFLGVVLAHGAYDAFIAVPDLAEWSLVSMIVFVLLVYQFFHELREQRGSANDTISLTATFVVGVTLVAAAAFVYLCGTVGTPIAFLALADDVTGLAVVVYLFLREIPESLM